MQTWQLIVMQEVAIKMPLMKNKRAIKPGDQLVVFRKKEVKVPDLCELVSLGGANKAPPCKVS